MENVWKVPISFDDFYHVSFNGDFPNRSLLAVLRGSTRSWKVTVRTVLRSVPISGASCSDGEISSEKWVPQQKLCHFLRKKRAGRKWWPVLAHRASFKTCSCPNLIPIETSQLEGFKISRTQLFDNPLIFPRSKAPIPKILEHLQSLPWRLVVATWQRVQSSCRPLPGTPRFSALWLDSCTFAWQGSGGSA